MNGTPKQVFIIRHGEKPGDPSQDLPDDGRDLSTRGFERAAALGVAIAAMDPRPDVLFAAQESVHSNRPVQTITPLSQALQCRIDSDFADKDYQKLADHLFGDGQYADKVVLICWHHGKIPELTTALGGTPPFAPWPGAVFDRLWCVDYSVPARPGSRPVANTPQKLLFGDSST